MIEKKVKKSPETKTEQTPLQQYLLLPQWFAVAVGNSGQCFYFRGSHHSEGWKMYVAELARRWAEHYYNVVAGQRELAGNTMAAQPSPIRFTVCEVTNGGWLHVVEELAFRLCDDEDADEAVERCSIQLCPTVDAPNTN